MLFKPVAITVGFGSLIGDCSNVVSCFNSILTLYPGTPISGALLTSNYTWWIPGLFSGVSRPSLLFSPESTSSPIKFITQQIASLAGAVMFIIMRYMFLRRQRVDALLLGNQAVS